MKNHLAIRGSFVRRVAVNSIIAISLASGPARSPARALMRPPNRIRPRRITPNSEARSTSSRRRSINSKAINSRARPAPTIPDTNQSAFHAFHFTSGYDPAVGFVIRSDDGQFSLHPGIVMDFRNMTSYREERPAQQRQRRAQAG